MSLTLSFYESEFTKKIYDPLKNDFKFQKDLHSKINDITLPFLLRSEIKREDIVKMKQELCKYWNEEEARSILQLFRLKSKF